MPRPRRALSPAYQARNARARALGYRSYYDYRVHDHGRIPASSPAPRGEARQRLRGHRSAADLRRAQLDGALVMLANHSERDPNTGRYQWVELTLVDSRGRERTYRLTGKQLETDRLRGLIADVQGGGAVLSPSPSLDLRQYAEQENDLDEDLGELEAA